MFDRVSLRPRWWWPILLLAGCGGPGAPAGGGGPGPTPSAGAGAGAGARASGPHPSLADYCASELAALDGADACRYGDEDGLCGCAVIGADDAAGPLTATGAGVIRTATLVRTARAASDLVRCELALELADGWVVHRDTFACGPAPAGAAEGQATTLTITGLTIRGDAVTLGWTTTDHQPDPDLGREVAAPAQAHGLTCRVRPGPDVACEPAR